MIKLRNVEEWDTNFGAPAAKITWLVDGNPKRPHGKAHERFENYFGTATVEEYLNAGGTKGDLRYDWQHEFLDVELPPRVETSVAAAETPTVAEEPRQPRTKREKLANAQTADEVVDELLR